MSYNTIRIRAAVYQGLQEIQLPRESYSEVIARLLQIYQESKKRRRRHGQEAVK